MKNQSYLLRFQAEDRANYEIMKSQAYAARIAKRIRKQPKIRAFTDDEPTGNYFPIGTYRTQILYVGACQRKSHSA